MQLEQSSTLERAGLFSELVKAEIVSLSCRMYWVQLRNASVDHHRLHIDHPRTGWTRSPSFSGVAPCFELGYISHHPEPPFSAISKIQRKGRMIIAVNFQF